jgi:hypothetical protein
MQKNENGYFEGEIWILNVKRMNVFIKENIDFYFEEQGKIFSKNISTKWSKNIPLK